MQDQTGIKRSPEKCPECGTAVMVKASGAGEYHQLMRLNFDGSQHHCSPPVRQYVNHAIGKAVTGKMVTRFELRGHRLTLTLDDGNVLSVSSPRRALNLQLAGPAGIMQE